MRIISLTYHDVVCAARNGKSSGFDGRSPSRYILDQNEFETHLAAIAAVRDTSPQSVLRVLEAPSEPRPFLLTFDDGAASAYTCIAELLDGYNWRAHFFITTDYIGAPHHLTKEQIRDIRQRGHLIGSHSCSHPHQMSNCSMKQMMEEWTQSVKVLSDVLGEQVTIASVPGGHYSMKVARAASASGIKVLFNSEPVTSCHTVDGCTVLGRYSILRGTPPIVAARLSVGEPGPRLRQLLIWNLKKIPKYCAGESYLKIRKRILSHR